MAAFVAFVKSDYFSFWHTVQLKSQRLLYNCFCAPHNTSCLQVSD